MHTRTHTHTHTRTRTRTHTHTHTHTHAHTQYTCSPLNPSGQGNLTPLNCNSTSDSVCVMNVIRGQPVTLCAAFTTIPPSIPEGGRVSNLSGSAWYFKNGSDNVLLYICTSSCDSGHSLDHSLYTYVNISCLTINNVQENQQYLMLADFEPLHSPRPSVIFDVTYEGVLCVWV